MMSRLFPLVFGAMAIFFFGVGLRGIVTRKPFLISSRWLFGLMVVAFAPTILQSFTLGLTKKVGISGLSLMTWLNPVMFSVILFMMWIQMKGYMAFGVTDVSFREALLHALKKLNIKFEETLSCVKLLSHSAELQVSVYSRMGSGQIRLKHSADKELLLKIKDEMNSYFRSVNTETNMTTCIFYVIMGIFMAVLAFGFSFTFSSIGKFVGK